MLNKPKITLYSHGIIVRIYNEEWKRAMIAYCYKLAQFEWVKKPPKWKSTKIMTRVFAGATKDRSEFRFHRELESDLFQHLSSMNIRRSSFDLVELDVPPGLDVIHPLKDGVTPYDYQEGLIDFLADTSLPTRVTNLQTGRGKTLSALSAMTKVKKRTVIQLRGGYVARWIEDLEGLFTYKKGELLVVKGRDALMSIMNMALADDLDAKVIIITNKTLFNYIKDYEQDKEMFQYPIVPEKLYEVLQVGLKIIDEIHEDYHLNFRSDIYSNIANEIGLSATLDTEDSQRKQFYDIALPKKYWYSGVEYVKYIGAIALCYNSKTPEKIKTNERGRTTYAHSAYEKSIMQYKGMTLNYMNIITYAVQHYFIETYDVKQKCIVFCYLVDMCMLVRDFLQDRYPELDVQVYVAETDPKVLETADIIVSTVKSAGTAQDIKGLKTAVLTHAVNKLETNEQVKGRLRQMKDYPDVTPQFVYLTNTDVEAHTRYMEDKYRQFEGKVIYHRTEHTPMQL